MRQKSGTSKDAADKLVRGIKRKACKQYSAEEKIRIVVAGLRGEESITALCRRDAGDDRHSQQHLLRLVRPLGGRRDRRACRLLSPAEVCVEPDSG